MAFIYIVFQFIVGIWDESNDKPGKIRIRCNNLTEILDSSQTALKTNKIKKLQGYLKSN